MVRRACSEQGMFPLDRSRLHVSFLLRRRDEGQVEWQCHRPYHDYSDHTNTVLYYGTYDGTPGWDRVLGGICGRDM